MRVVLLPLRGDGGVRRAAFVVVIAVAVVHRRQVLAATAGRRSCGSLAGRGTGGLLPVVVGVEVVEVVEIDNDPRDERLEVGGRRQRHEHEAEQRHRIHQLVASVREPPEAPRRERAPHEREGAGDLEQPPRGPGGDGDEHQDRVPSVDQPQPAPALHQALRLRARLRAVDRLGVLAEHGVGAAQREENREDDEELEHGRDPGDDAHGDDRLRMARHDLRVRRREQPGSPAESDAQRAEHEVCDARDDADDAVPAARRCDTVPDREVEGRDAEHRVAEGAEDPGGRVERGAVVVGLVEVPDVDDHHDVRDAPGDDDDRRRDLVHGQRPPQVPRPAARGVEAKEDAPERGESHLDDEEAQDRHRQVAVRLPRDAAVRIDNGDAAVEAGAVPPRDVKHGRPALPARVDVQDVHPRLGDVHAAADAQWRVAASAVAAARVGAGRGDGALGDAVDVARVVGRADVERQ
mmetsp:Transcript_36837/g.113701  ORF Transcript_36837/g.113701 Transcript_36837/m.113701 type:complete len:464 (-) Transcript_36837:446-1837(-)